MAVARWPEGWILVASGNDQSRAELSVLLMQLGLRTAIATTGAEALLAARAGAPTLVVLEVELEQPSGYEVCRELREECGESLPIVFVTATRAEPHDEIAALLLGADDYFVKPLGEEPFLARMRRLLERASDISRPRTLTAREQEVLGLLIDGRRTAEIADQLCITPKTAATHIERILAKLGAHSQAHAVAIAMRDKLLPRI